MRHSQNDHHSVQSNNRIITSMPENHILLGERWILRTEWGYGNGITTIAYPQQHIYGTLWTNCNSICRAQTKLVAKICWWHRPNVNMASCGQWTGEVLKTSQHSKTIRNVHIEKENTGKLPFLDILIDRKNDKITTSVHRKPNHTGQYLHYTFNHPKSTKQAIVTSLQNRAVICSNEDNLHKEYRQTASTLTANGHPQNILT